MMSQISRLCILEGIRTSSYFPEEMQGMVTILEENNIGLLNLILHLMFRAALDGGTVTLNRFVRKNEEYKLHELISDMI